MTFAKAIGLSTMRIHESLSKSFGKEFQELLESFLRTEQRIESEDRLDNRRFLTRSIVPHAERLSELFNRQNDALEKNANYWNLSSNPKNLRLAYFLLYMPCNLMRVAAVVAELSRLGWDWSKTIRAVEWGAGPASGTCGVAAGLKQHELSSSKKLPEMNFALIEQDATSLELGEKWAKTYFESLGFAGWSTRKFHRTVDWTQSLLPRSAPSFHLWLSSYFMNEARVAPEALAESLTKTWIHHLEEDGLAIFVEPALKEQSRKLLTLRKHLIEYWSSPKYRGPKFQVLLPCLGEQACGALAAAEDWCHDEAIWWRPPYLKNLDDLLSLDHKSLPMSYLVITKSERPIEELLPQLPASPRYRLVSPAHSEGRDLEFFICGQDGKRRARYRAPEDELAQPTRGSILGGVRAEGDPASTRLREVKEING